MTTTRTTPSSPRAAARSGAQGFLLVEALATMAISTFLLVAMASVVSLTLRASQRAERTSQDVEETSRTLAALMRDIEQVEPVRWAGAGAGFVFEGTADSLSFARKAPLPDGSFESRFVSFRRAGLDLIAQERVLPPTATGPGDLGLVSLQDVLQKRYRVQFAYFSRLDAGQEALTDSWDNDSLLPVAVRISLFDRDGAVRGSVRIPILVDAEPGCAAPGKALCNFVPIDAAAKNDRTPPASDVDADDKLGWLRYLRQ